MRHRGPNCPASSPHSGPDRPPAACIQGPSACQQPAFKARPAASSLHSRPDRPACRFKRVPERRLVRPETQGPFLSSPGTSDCDRRSCCHRERKKKPPGDSRRRPPGQPHTNAAQQRAAKKAVRGTGGEPPRGPAGQGRPARGSGVCRVFADRRLRRPGPAPPGASLCQAGEARPGRDRGRYTGRRLADSHLASPTSMHTVGPPPFPR